MSLFINNSELGESIHVPKGSPSGSQTEDVMIKGKERKNSKNPYLYNFSSFLHSQSS